MSNKSKYTSLPVQENQSIDLGMLAKWGKPEDNAIRNEGSQIQSPIISLDTPLQFEQRILKPSKYGSLKNGDGTESTHRMAYAEVDGQYIAYPTIVQGGKSSLLQLDDDRAINYALEKGEHRSFKTEAEARNYAEGGYKKFWGLGEKK